MSSKKVTFNYSSPTYLNNNPINFNSQTSDEIQREDYFYLSKHEQKKIREKIRNAVVHTKTQFSKMIQNFKSRNNIFGVNLLLGTTGSGKSTLFNYIQNFPLIVYEEITRQGTPLLKLDENFIRKNPTITHSLIGTGFISKTNYPIFAKGDENYINVDLPGQFDNKDLIQSIVNALLRINICQVALHIKITIVISFNQFNNRAAAFKKTVQEIQKFFGNWGKFDPNAVLLMITQVPDYLQDPLMAVKNKLLQIASFQTQDILSFTPILKSIIQNQAFGIMPTPSKIIIPRRNNNRTSNTHKKYEQIVPVGQIYSPEKTLCSPQSINKLIVSREFMKRSKGLLCPGIKAESIKIVQDICYSIIDQLKSQHFQMMVKKLKEMDKDKLEYYLKIIRNISDIKQLRNFFQIDEYFESSSLIKDLNYFLKLTNIKSFDQQLLGIKRDLDQFILKMINEFDEKQLKKQELMKKKKEKQLKRLNKLKEKRQKLRQIEHKIKKLASKRPECKQMEQMKDQWFQLKQQISDKQNDQQKQLRSNLENFDLLRIQSHREVYLKKKRKEFRDQKSRCQDYIQNKQSSDIIFNLLVTRRLNKIDQQIKNLRGIFQEIRRKSQKKLSQNELLIQQAQSKINDWKHKRRNEQNQKKKDNYKNWIEKQREKIQKLENQWFNLKDQVSDLQDDEQKRQKQYYQQQYQQFDEDLTKETNDQDLDIQELKQKINRMQEKTSRYKEQIKDIQKDEVRLQYLKIVRRRQKLKQRIRLCIQILWQKGFEYSDEEDSSNEQDENDSDEQDENDSDEQDENDSDEQDENDSDQQDENDSDQQDENDLEDDSEDNSEEQDEYSSDDSDEEDESDD